MVEISKHMYEGFEIRVKVSERGKFYAEVPALSISSSSGKGDCGYNTIEECITDVKSQVDLFLKSSISTYDELAKVITDKLTWTGYEECYLDTEVLKNIIKQVKFTTLK